MKFILPTSLLKGIVVLLLIAGGTAHAQNSQFNGKMSRAQLEDYLDRTMVLSFDSLDKGMPAYNDLVNFAARCNARCLANTFTVGYGSELPINFGFFNKVQTAVTDIQNAYAKKGLVAPMVGAAIWESVTKNVDSIWMNDEVANTFHVAKRRFIYDSIKYMNDPAKDRATPDISRPETQMYFYYLATEFIKSGIEVLHMGIIEYEDKNDTNHLCTWDLLCKIRDYGATKNRGIVLINADTWGVRLKKTDTLLYDYVMIPTRVSGYYTGHDSTWSSMWNYRESPYGGPGRLSVTDCSPFGKIGGGYVNLGWYADSIPYQVVLDNTLTNNCNCLVYATCYTVYGFDEISWFTLQSEDYRNEWLCYANSETKRLDKNCHFVMPGRKIYSRRWSYYSAMNGYGFNQEDAIINTWNGTQKDCNPNDKPNLREIWGSGKNLAVMVYPNPVTDAANIVYTAPPGNEVTLKIIDVLGKTVAYYETGKNHGSFLWDTHSIPTGNYFCTASAEKGDVASFRITVLR